MRIIIDLDENDEPELTPEQLLDAAYSHEREIRAARNVIRREVRRLAKLWHDGLLKPEISRGEHAQMREAYFANGGTVTKCPPATAYGASTSPFWDVDKGALIPNVREIALTETPDGHYEATITREED